MLNAYNDFVYTLILLRVFLFPGKLAQIDQGTV